MIYRKEWGLIAVLLMTAALASFRYATAAITPPRCPAGQAYVDLNVKIASNKDWSLASSTITGKITGCIER